MHILVVNDDGVFAPGIELLARHALRFGEVTVVAPSRQCSAMSQQITIFRDLTLREYDFPVEGVRAYSLDGTPADCVIAATDYLLPGKIDYVFSGINNGYNVGHDIIYSGTIGAASEAVMRSLPAAAFSIDLDSGWELADGWLDEIIPQLLRRPLPEKALWNVNFPGGGAAACRGIRYDCAVANTTGYYKGTLARVAESEDGGTVLRNVSYVADPLSTAENSDLRAVAEGYIAIGVYRPGVL